MRCLLTGASGFLGKRVLKLLIEDPRIEQINVISRNKKTHPCLKVKIQSADLGVPWGCDGYFENLDFIIHLAGLYEFNLPLSQNYQQNVLTSLNLINKIKQLKTFNKPQIIFASTYAVGLGSNTSIAEAPLDNHPPIQEAYAYSKALGERAISDSGLSARIFRLGILVGDRKKGIFEKFDGPYAMMRFLNHFSQTDISQLIHKMPIPLVRSGILPLVPVDSAAEILHQALFLERLLPNQQKYYGVFRSESIQMEYFSRKILRFFLPHCEPVFIPKVPSWILKAQTYLTKIPREIFNYSLTPIPLENPRFQAEFGSQLVPHFDTYENVFFDGFRNCVARTESRPVRFVEEG